MGYGSARWEELVGLAVTSAACGEIMLGVPTDMGAQRNSGNWAGQLVGWWGWHASCLSWGGLMSGVGVFLCNFKFCNFLFLFFILL